MIQNWKQAPKMYSVQVAALIAIVAALEPFIPALRGNLPDEWVTIAAVLVVMARLMRQRSLEQSTPADVWEAAMRAKDGKQ